MPRRKSDRAPEKSKDTRGHREDGGLQHYFRDMSHSNVMTAEEELKAATNIANLRTAFWRSLLGYPPFIDAIVETVCECHPPDKTPIDVLEQLKKTSRDLRDRDLVAHQQAFAAAREAAADALSYLDVDAVASDRILADLLAIHEGKREGLQLRVKLPRRGSAPYAQYVQQAQRDNSALLQAKSEFVLANLRLVVTLAKRFNNGRMPLQDLIQEGNIGLMKAVDRFDHRRGFRFSTYGTWWIRHAISRAIADKAREVRLPVHMLEAYGKVKRASREFETQHGRKPTDAELAEKVELPVERIRRMYASLVEAPQSLSQPISRDSAMSLLDLLEDDDAVEPSSVLDAQILLHSLQELLDALAPIEADILRSRMGFGDNREMTLKELGERYSLSRERIRQLQERALSKLRREFKRRSLM